jgi:hypothetical protein
MKGVARKARAHLDEAGKSYLQHLRGAARTSRQCFLAGTAALIHGVLPFLFVTTASDAVREMYRRQNPGAGAHRRRRR